MKTACNFTVSIAIVFAALDLTTPAFAGDFEERCVAISMNDTLPSDMSAADVSAVCSCLAEKAEADPAVMEDLEPGLDIADFEERMASVGGAGQGALDACS